MALSRAAIIQVFSHVPLPKHGLTSLFQQLNMISLSLKLLNSIIHSLQFIKNCLLLLRKLAPAKDPVQGGAAAKKTIRSATQVVMVGSILTVVIKGRRRKVQKVMAKQVKKIQVLRKRNWVLQHNMSLKRKVFLIITFLPQLFFCWPKRMTYLHLLQATV